MIDDALLTTESASLHSPAVPPAHLSSLICLHYWQVNKAPRQRLIKRIHLEIEPIIDNQNDPTNKACDSPGSFYCTLDSWLFLDLIFHDEDNHKLVFFSRGGS